MIETTLAMASEKREPFQMVTVSAYRACAIALVTLALHLS
jgi:hypothetical protein